MRWLLAMAFMWVLGSPAAAAWHEAQSEHFVIYADDTAPNVQRFAEMLERYHAALVLLTSREVAAPSPSNRVTIFAVGGERDMRQLTGSRQVAGFYSPRAGASRAFVPDIRIRQGEPDFSMTVLLHEYAHHFLMSTSRFAMPGWLNEGAAEFFASAALTRAGTLQIGRPANHRAGELQAYGKIRVEQLLDPTSGASRSDSFYGSSWLLYHYLSFEPDRRGQLETYWRAVTAGTSFRTAAQQAFGDLARLDQDLVRYMRRSRMMTFDLNLEMLPIAPVSVRAASEGMGKALPLIIVSQRGVDRESALELVPKIRSVAERYSDDPQVLAALAEAEFDAGNDAEAIAAADRALALDPTVVNALVQKGYALFRIAQDAEKAEDAYREALRPFTALNQLENDHPLPLIYFYRSFVDRGAEPNELARQALERAAELAPFDQNLWMQAALMEAAEGKIAIALQNLGPLAINPHGSEISREATLLMAALEQAPEGEAFDAVAYLASVKTGPTPESASAEGGPAPAGTS